MSIDAAKLMARAIVREKYRHCEWDKEHPQVDAEQDISDKLAVILFKLAEARREAELWMPLPETRTSGVEPQQPLAVVSWGLFCEGELVEEFPFRDRAVAERRFRELRLSDSRSYELRDVRRDIRT